MLNWNRYKSNHLARNHPRKEPSPIRRPKAIYSSSARCAHTKNYQGIAVSVAAHEREVYSGEANGLLEKLWRPLLKTRRSNRYGVCYKCGDLHTNLSRHKSGCDRTLPETIPPHSDGLSGEPFARNPATPSTPALQWKVPIKANSLHRADFCRGE